MKVVSFFLVTLCFFISDINAQISDKYQTYNVNRAVEELNNGNEASAKEYLDKELNENPKNHYARIWMGAINSSEGYQGKGLSLIEDAIKDIPKKEKELMSFAYYTKAYIYENIDEKEKAIDAYTRSIKYTPDDVDLYNKRGNLYYLMSEYDLSDKDFKKAIELKPEYIYGYMGLGRNEISRERYNEAIELFDYVEKLASDYSSVYSFRAECNYKLKDYNKAADDIIKALSIDGDDKAFNIMMDMGEKAKDILIAKLRIKRMKSPSEGYWSYCIGLVYEVNNDYGPAVENYKECLKQDNDAITAIRISSCYQAAGNYDRALEYIDYAIDIDSTDNGCRLSKADILYEMGDYDEAISQISDYINNNPEYFGGYYKRGFYKDNTKDYDGAIEDYSVAIIQNPDYAYAYLGRADMYRMKGEMEKAEADYRKVIELDTIPSENSCIQYAYMQLGYKDKAKAYMDKVLAAVPDDYSGTYYDAACLYSRLGEYDKALKFLKTAFEKGFRNFGHLLLDDDLDPIKNTQEFQSAINYYRSRIIEVEEEEKAGHKDKVELSTLNVPFKKDDGVCVVKCEINDLPLNFIFDTGASDVSISDIEANFMFKNDYLNKSDILGKQNYITADGRISEGTVINLKNINIGGLELNNVRASVVKNQRAPLLLGQSVLSRLGKIEIDNEKNTLKITYKKISK